MMPVVMVTVVVPVFVVVMPVVIVVVGMAQEKRIAGGLRGRGKHRRGCHQGDSDKGDLEKRCLEGHSFCLQGPFTSCTAQGFGSVGIS